MDFADFTDDPPDPEHPPVGVRNPLLWRLGAQLLIDHRAQSIVPPWLTEPACRGCGRSWPCDGYRLGERGIRAAQRDRLGSQASPSAGSERP